MKTDISVIFKKLHKIDDLPRLEIEGLKESPESEYLGFFPYDASGSREERAVYVLKDWYDESGGGSDNDWDYIIFQKSALEKIVEMGINSKSYEATLKTSGTRVTFRNHWNALGEGWEDPKKEEHIDLSLSLAISKNKPRFSIEY